MAVKKTATLPDLVIYSYSKDTAFTAAQMNATFLLIEGIGKGYLPYQKKYIKLQGI